jgi:hypothetical protein
MALRNKTFGPAPGCLGPSRISRRGLITEDSSLVLCLVAEIRAGFPCLPGFVLADDVGSLGRAKPVCGPDGCRKTLEGWDQWRGRGGRSGGAIGVGLVGYGLSGSVFHAPLIDAEERLRLM